MSAVKCTLYGIPSKEYFNAAVLRLQDQGDFGNLWSKLHQWWKEKIASMMKGNSPSTTFFQAETWLQKRQRSGVSFNLTRKKSSRVPSFLNSIDFPWNMEIPVSAHPLRELIQTPFSRKSPRVTSLSVPEWNRLTSNTSEVNILGADYTNTGKWHPTQRSVLNSISFVLDYFSSCSQNWMFTCFNSPHLSIIMKGCDDVTQSCF